MKKENVVFFIGCKGKNFWCTKRPPKTDDSCDEVSSQFKPSPELVAEYQARVSNPDALQQWFTELNAAGIVPSCPVHGAIRFLNGEVGKIVSVSKKNDES